MNIVRRRGNVVRDRAAVCDRRVIVGRYEFGVTSAAYRDRDRAYL